MINTELIISASVRPLIRAGYANIHFPLGAVIGLFIWTSVARSLHLGGALILMGVVFLVLARSYLSTICRLSIADRMLSITRPLTIDTIPLEDIRRFTVKTYPTFFTIVLTLWTSGGRLPRKYSLAVVRSNWGTLSETASLLRGSLEQAIQQERQHTR